MKWYPGVINKKQINLHVWFELGAHTQQEEQFINTRSEQTNTQSLFLFTQSNHQNKYEFYLIRPTAEGAAFGHNLTTYKCRSLT